MRPALLRLALRHLPKRVFQSLLVLLGIALGVAVVVAVDIANASARRAFQLSTELVVGRATHQISGGPSGVPAEVYRRVRTELGAYPVAPVVEGYVRAEALGGRALRLLGVDAFSEPPFRDYLGGQQALPIEVATALLVVPGSVLLAEAEAQRYGLETGDLVSLEVGSNRVEVRVVGLLKPRDEVSRRA
ncbi:MAG TPA: ABC transporter permease, partial [Ardenticatenaceae bacterium]|nr:ABC transporter permease [Ardenticatenaceae bacterium]